MRPARTAVVCALLAVALALPAAAATARTPEQTMIHHVNQYRAKHGKPALRPSRSLARSSRRFARHLMKHDRFAHGARISVSRRFRAAGENLAMHTTWSLRVRHTVRAWIRSRGHRAILLSSRFRWIGVGRSAGGFRGRRSTIWVLHAAR